MAVAYVHPSSIVTGSSSGFGLLLTKKALESGDTVIATLRKPPVLKKLQSQYPEGRLHLIKVDVTKKEEVVAGFKYAAEEVGRIDIVFNNAGYTLLGEAEGTDEESARKQFEVNYWGALAVSTESVKFFREVNKPQGGKLWNVSSAVGWTAPPALSQYSASKHALEGATEALALELDPAWNIKISLLEFGSFRTRILAPESLITLPVHPAYTNPNLMTHYVRGFFDAGEAPGDSEKAINVLYDKVADDPNPPLRIPLGQDALRDVRVSAQKILEDCERTAPLSADLLYVKS
ncbi:NAD-P-binding protein [Thelephora ganbajun]|uniref:NAD-P-binding protein n=1 Tax=Thelephora ganbajun TaxID=370292 RepID=A0ACB6ZHA3_THEGA|nr:NAD-P-binding protein [Thelephora ganbajun]